MGGSQTLLMKWATDFGMQSCRENGNNCYLKIHEKVRAGIVLNKQLREVQLFVMNMACLLVTFSTFEDSYQKKRKKREGSHSPAAGTVLPTHWREDLTLAGGVISSFELFRNAMHQNHAFLLSHSVGLLSVLSDQSLTKTSILTVRQWPQLAMPAHPNPWQQPPEVEPKGAVTIVVQQHIQPHQVFPRTCQEFHHHLQEVLCRTSGMHLTCQVIWLI